MMISYKQNNFRYLYIYSYSNTKLITCYNISNTKITEGKDGY